MKQLLFLLLFPCLALAQYQGNAGQKITLGEQTTADGLVFRGLAADTTRKPSVDTMAFILLDTNTNIIWQYKKEVNNAWTRVGGSISSGVTGVLPVANGGTGADMTSLLNNYLVRKNSSGVFDTAAIYEAGGNVGIGKISQVEFKLDVSGVQSRFLSTSNTPLLIDRSGGNGVFIALRDGSNLLSFFGNNNGNFLIQTPGSGYANKLVILNNGNVGIGETTPAVQFHTTGAVRFAGLTSIQDLETDADGDLVSGSDYNLKNSIEPISSGINEVLKLNPVQFYWNKESRNLLNKNYGFIAQDVMVAIPNAASTMGDGYMQVDYNAIVATLTKAIQEQQALIKALEQRLLILENK